MRAKEFITERAFPDSKSGPMSTTYQYPGMPSSDGYQIYRFGLAMADHTLTHAVGPTSRNAVVVAYTEGDEEIIQGAERQTGKQGVRVADRTSHESAGTNTASPVAQPRKNRYGV